MAVSGAQVSVGTSATPLNVAETDLVGGQSVAIWCASSIALGGSGVTWAAGAQLAANTPLAIDLNPGEILYAATQTGTATVHVVHQGA